MNNTYVDYLINQAQEHWRNGNPCPVDIITKLGAEGIDAVALENQFNDEEVING